jgi:DNA-binding XRE family transcriptional regulator
MKLSIHPETLGGLLQRTRLLRRQKQSDVAILLGVTRSSVSLWERDVVYPEIAHHPNLRISVSTPYHAGSQRDRMQRMVSLLSCDSGVEYSIGRYRDLSCRPPPG